MSGSRPFSLHSVLRTLVALASAFSALRTGGVAVARGESPGPSSDAVKTVSVLPTATAKPEGRVRGEFEDQAALIVGFNELVQYHPEILVQLVAAVHERIKVIGVVADEDQRAKVVALLQEKRLSTASVELFSWPVEAMWVGEYAPFFVTGDQTTAVAFTYGERNRDLENAFGVAFAATFRLQFDHCRLTLDGGNLLVNGKGTVVTTTKVAAGNADRKYDAARVGELLHDHFHFNRWIHLTALKDEPTGNADMFVTFCAANKALVGVCRAEDDADNAKLLDENATILKGEPTTNGPLDVIRIPMPSHKDGKWRTYTSVIYANGVVLVPQYPDTDPKLDKVALTLFGEALPDWKVVGIDCSKLIAKRGALHSLARQVPALDERK
jgi:agmatine/peptidylarginine deiminase